MIAHTWLAHDIVTLSLGNVNVLIKAVLFLSRLVLLFVGERLLAFASVDTARSSESPPLVIGLTLVAWGTSAPELALMRHFSR